MQQLTGFDASFPCLETPNAPLQLSELVIYEQAAEAGK